MSPHPWRDDALILIALIVLNFVFCIIATLAFVRSL